jgi:pimeloyl-ACP methyl ester carboxylesterase
MRPLVEDVLGLADALGYEQIDLVGHDWGAAVAWAIALWHPERVRKLGILNVPHPAVMMRFLGRDPEQIRRSWYIFLFQLPWLPEYLLRRRDWRNAVRLLRGSGRLHTFTDEDIDRYKEAWSQPGAMRAMLNWYRALVRHRPGLPRNPVVKVPTLMMWGMRDVALSHRMARPSLDYCADGRLVFFEDATHWVQHDEAELVTQYLLEFLN